jgi:hypothetical protein
MVAGAAGGDHVLPADAGTLLDFFDQQRDGLGFRAPATTRSWKTILSVLRILKSHEPGK